MVMTSFLLPLVSARVPLTTMYMKSGTYPVNTDEALLNQAALEQLGLHTGSTVTVTVPDGSQKKYRITGVFENMGSLLKADVYGMVLSEDGFREIADEAAKDGTMFRIQFKSGVNIFVWVQPLSFSCSTAL